jgi:hypothetical protein
MERGKNESAHSFSVNAHVRHYHNFLLDGSLNVVKLDFPTFYAGRLSFLPQIPRHVPPPLPSDLRETVGTTLIKVELKNGARQRRTLDPAAFAKNRNGRYFSPLIYLP